MKKLFLFLAFIPCLAFAQSKEETESWLLKQVPTRSLNQDLEYTFDGGEILSTATYRISGGKTKSNMPLKDVKTISIEQTEDYLAVHLRCEDQCAYFVTTDRNNKFESDRKSEKTFFAMFKKTEKEMPARLQKAMLHLIELNGGKAKVVPYVKVKEKEAF